MLARYVAAVLNTPTHQDEHPLCGPTRWTYLAVAINRIHRIVAYRNPFGINGRPGDKVTMGRGYCLGLEVVLLSPSRFK